MRSEGCGIGSTGGNFVVENAARGSSWLVHPHPGGFTRLGVTPERTHQGRVLGGGCCEMAL